MSASDIAGVPLSEKSMMLLVLRLPDGDWSVTVPFTMTLCFQGLIRHFVLKLWLHLDLCRMRIVDCQSG